MKIQTSSFARILVFVVCLSITLVCSAQNNWCVATDGADDNSGTSWQEPLLTIAKAIEISENGDKILVSNGTYMVTEPVLFADRIVASVNGPHVTTIDGGDATRCVTMTHTNSCLDGFTVANGMDGRGGGIHISGGGVITNCRIIDNVSTSTASKEFDGGGGIAVATGGARIFNCWIYGNSASNGGGGIRIVNSGTQLLVRDTTIEGNQSASATYAGGGISAYNSGGELRLENCLFLNNFTEKVGGAVNLYYGTLEVDRCRFIANYATERVAGLLTYSVGNVTIRNSLFALNEIGPGGRTGSAIYDWRTSSTGKFIMDNCTIVSNTALAGPGGGLALAGTAVGNHEINNTVCYYNKGQAGSSNIYVSADVLAGNIVFNNCCSAPVDLLPGANNISDEPGISDWQNAGYELNPSSKCINAGIELPWMSLPGALDLDGYTRVDRFFNKVDIGCYEYLPAGMTFKLR